MVLNPYTDPEPGRRESGSKSVYRSEPGRRKSGSKSVYTDPEPALGS